MRRQPFMSRRLLLLASSGVLLAACSPSDPAFIYRASPSTTPPEKMQRLLLWLPPNDDYLDGKGVSTAFVAALAPYRVAVETGRSSRLELARSEDQKALIEQFKPTYRLEIDVVEGTSEAHSITSTTSSTKTTATSIILRGVLYRGADRTPLARFHYRAKSKSAPVFVALVVEKLRADGYL